MSSTTVRMAWPGRPLSTNLQGARGRVLGRVVAREAVHRLVQVGHDLVGVLDAAPAGRCLLEVRHLLHLVVQLSSQLLDSGVRTSGGWGGGGEGGGQQEVVVVEVVVVGTGMVA